MPTTKFARRLICAAAILGPAALFLLLIALWGPMWHLVHGGSIFYQGWRIPVPEGFYVRNNQKGPKMWKHALGTPILRVPYAVIGIHATPTGHPFRAEADYEHVSKAVTAVAEEEGYQFQSTRAVSGQHSVADCWEFVSTKSKSEVTVRCVVEGTHLFFIYMGYPRYVPSFYSSLRDISPVDESNRTPHPFN